MAQRQKRQKRQTKKTKRKAQSKRQPATRKRVGRPPEPVPEELSEAVCAHLRQGHSLRAISRMPGMPSVGAVLDWAAKDDRFAERYARARQVGLEIMADEILDISDDDQEDPHRSKLRVDARKWILAKQMPQKYGDRQHIEHSGSIRHQLSVEERRQRVAALMDQGRQRAIEVRQNGQLPPPDDDTAEG